MEGKFILAIDQGTTGSTALVVDFTKGAEVIGRCTVDFPQHYPRTGWVEHDLEEIWRSVAGAVQGALDRAAQTNRQFTPARIAGLGITNQRETLCVFDRVTGRPVHRAIVWQCKRSSAITRAMKDAGHEREIRERTGLVLDPYFSGSKITWLLENVPEAAQALRSGKACVGTIDTFLIHRLTGGRSFVTEASNASRTMLYNIDQGSWDPDLLEMFRIPGSGMLPQVLDSSGEFGRTSGLSWLPDGIPIAGVLGDQQAALAGQACFDQGEAKCTYGTGAFLLANLGSRKMLSRAGLLTTVAWSLGGELTYAFEGSAFIAGAAVQFLRDQFRMIAHARETQDLARDAIGAPEVYFVPALAGLGAPYWDPQAQGAILGLTRGTTTNQIVRAVLEGIAFQVADLTGSIAADLGRPLNVLRVDGGAAANDLLMQSQAEYCGIPVDRPRNLETTAFGAALFAAMGIGLYRELSDLRNVRQTERIFSPGTSAANDVKHHLDGWKRAVRATQVFAGSV